MTSNESLRNFILQKIIRKVRLNKKTFSFVEDQTELSDELLSTLISECAKYGFKESDARQYPDKVSFPVFPPLILSKVKLYLLA